MLEDIWKDRVVFITGATEGLGLFLATTLVQHGAKIIANGRRDKNVIDQALLHPNIEYVSFDLERTDQIQELTLQVISAWGKIDVLINNAVTFENKSIDEITDIELNSNFRVNTFAPFLLAKNLYPYMEKNNWGRIIMINSEAALQVKPDIACYSASKVALLSLSRALAQELRGKNITVNSIILGPLATPYFQEIYRKVAFSKNLDEKKYISDALLNTYPRSTTTVLTSMHTVLSVISLFCNETSSEINGMALRVDGGAVPIIF
jgi:3-oxoacyl-[acyl-carrier protein] reductase